jgi:hypothetical protein
MQAQKPATNALLSPKLTIRRFVISALSRLQRFELAPPFAPNPLATSPKPSQTAIPYAAFSSTYLLRFCPTSSRLELLFGPVSQGSHSPCKQELGYLGYARAKSPNLEEVVAGMYYLPFSFLKKRIIRV